MPIFRSMTPDEYKEIKHTVRNIHNVVKDTFDYLRWTITIGAVYYLVSQTNRSLAILAVIILFCIITAPLIFLIQLVMLRVFSDALIIPAAIIGFMLIIGFTSAVGYYVIDIVNFLSTRR